ncbi:MAG: hypothetical protein HN368_23245 [Spirochaetales bacterium]|jgi:hypothetical protein|nr:hypothetical protein [Spirochaetales bacterium]
MPINNEFGDFSTGAAYMKDENDYPGATGFESPVSSNAQVRWWYEAMRLYEAKVRHSKLAHIDDLILVTTYLGQSLTGLFGRKFPGTPGRRDTPSLIGYIKYVLPENGLDLQSDQERYYSCAYDLIVDMDQYYTTITKHPDSNKEGMMKELTKEKVTKFMEATRRVWIWYGYKKFSDEITAASLVAFQTLYIDL